MACYHSRHFVILLRPWSRRPPTVRASGGRRRGGRPTTERHDVPMDASPGMRRRGRLRPRTRGSIRDSVRRAAGPRAMLREADSRTASAREDKEHGGKLARAIAHWLPAGDTIAGGEDELCMFRAPLRCSGGQPALHARRSPWSKCVATTPRRDEIEGLRRTAAAWRG